MKIWLKNNYLDLDDRWSGILADTAFALQITYHTMLQSTPVQLVLGRDMRLSTPLFLTKNIFGDFKNS